MDVAYHFKCYDNINYALFPENFILQSLSICGSPTVSKLYNGDILYEQSSNSITEAVSEKNLIAAWFKNAELQTKEISELTNSYVIRLCNITFEVDSILHLSLAQTEAYLGKVLVGTSLIHDLLYKAPLVCLGKIDTTRSEIILNISEYDYIHAGDHQRYAAFTSFGYKVRPGKAHELL